MSSVLVLFVFVAIAEMASAAHTAGGVPARTRTRTACLQLSASVMLLAAPAAPPVSHVAHLAHQVSFPQPILLVQYCPVYNFQMEEGRGGESLMA